MIGVDRDRGKVGEVAQYVSPFQEMGLRTEYKQYTQYKGRLETIDDLVSQSTNVSSRSFLGTQSSAAELSQ